MMRVGVQISIRRVATGFKEATLVCDSLDAGYKVAQAVIGSGQFPGCYAVGLDELGRQVFVVQEPPRFAHPHYQPPQTALPAPVYQPPCYAPQPPAPPTDYGRALPPPQPAYPYEYAARAPALPAYAPPQPVVCDAEFEDEDA